MLTQLAALGIGLITAVGAPAIAQADCGPAHPTSYPGYRAPGYPAATYPSPTYPAATYPAPSYAPAPSYGPQPGRRQQTPHAVVLRQADYNNDGGITLREAEAYGRTAFGRADDDRNGVLTRHEIHANDELARGARGRDGVVSFAEYDASLRRQFASLDRNRDGFLNRYELGRGPAPNTVTYNWHWKL